MHRLKGKDVSWKCYSKESRRGVIHISYGRLQIKKITRDERGNYFMKNGWSHRKYITILNECSGNNRNVKYVKLKQRIKKRNSQIHNYLWNCLSAIDGTQKNICHCTQALNNTINQKNTLNIYMTHYPTTKCMLFLSVHRTNIQLGHILYNTNLNKFKGIVILQNNVFSDNNGI